MSGEYLDRIIAADVRQGLKHYPVTAIVGPRQCGKSTLIRHLVTYDRPVVYLDLERPSDLRKLDDPEWFLKNQRESVVCIDEVQRKPELFPLIRSLVDEWGGNGHFLVLGSASRDLLKQSSESLAGRITYKRLTPFLWTEIKGRVTIEEYLARGGFPRSLLQEDAAVSFAWREDFITSFLERDLLQWSGFSPATMRRLWQMLAHQTGRWSTSPPSVARLVQVTPWCGITLISCSKPSWCQSCHPCCQIQANGLSNLPRYM